MESFDNSPRSVPLRQKKRRSTTRWTAWSHNVCTPSIISYGESGNYKRDLGGRGERRDFSSRLRRVVGLDRRRLAAADGPDPQGQPPLDRSRQGAVTP